MKKDHWYWIIGVLAAAWFLGIIKLPGTSAGNTAAAAAPDDFGGLF